MSDPRHLTTAELDAGLPQIQAAPSASGTLALIVRRPAIGAREVLAEGQLDGAVGLVGDNWPTRKSSSATTASPDPNTQINVMNARAIALVAGSRDRWPLAGDQLYVDLDLSVENLPAGTRLAVGTAVIEVTPVPHTGCAKFVERFGLEAMKFVNSPLGRELRLRGLNARVVQPGRIRTGDRVEKLLRLAVA